MIERPHQHDEGRYLAPSTAHRALTGGPIAVAPTRGEAFVAAVRAGGGDVQPLDENTKGLVWLSETRSDELSDILQQHPGIEWLQLPWAGVDAFSSILNGLAGTNEQDRPVVTSAKGAYSEPVAEHALALLLATLRELPQKARAARWKDERTGLSLFGNRVLLVGAGGVARAFMDLLAPFHCEVTVVRRDPSQHMEGAAKTVGQDGWRELLPEIDAVVLAAAHTDSTRAMWAAPEFDALPQHAVFVNIARGPLVDTPALVSALKSGNIAGAGLDVTDPEPLPDGHPLFDIPECVITSHAADTPAMTRPLLAARVTHNTKAFLSGSPLRGVVSVEEGY
ncbi:Phosphoglycerate dehydrogenase-like protein [Pontimonas salivibrio]|uniref:Phosphoglycerate dehydrogenase-like protein n=1 Tax=Pontimonas salivibrio TaxID=1159327 RepID=A0A2L2BQB6_9MICO|nr:NAD(P)-dependent oxidoreductase [Pontimonas salivibrio]AVG23802.1 Phosphoglycerate dehydrogenase-like protein [Pontimonas salivibrio]